jgi:hypothetical protein
LLDPALVEDRDAVGERERFLVIVGDEDRGQAELVVDLAQRAAQLAPDLGVERSERLVEQQDARVAGERPGERDALALAARQLARVALAEAGQLDQLEQLLDAAVDLVAFDGRGRAASREPEGDVLRDGHVAEQGIMLEHEADPARGSACRW